MSEEQQIFLREELHDLGAGMQISNFNVRVFKAQHEMKKRRKTLGSNQSIIKSINRISTEAAETSPQWEDTPSRSNAFQRMLKKRESGKYRRVAGSLKISKNKEQQTNIFERQSSVTNKYIKLEKQNNKTTLNKRIIENWLNNILLQSLQLELLDESLGNAALKKFQIDENSLLSRDLNRNQIDRIYRSLFVYSIGYNNFLKEIVRKNDIVLKNIWKVYSILLEFCAQGKYQTLIGTIQRQKEVQLAGLEVELQKKQEIIQKNEELNQQKNIQIFREIRTLKEENINLNNEKDILYEDFQKTDQAFNEEVALRLKFENKINELFGVHRQLAMKHERLYEDYKKKVIEWNDSTKKYENLLIEHKKLKLQYGETKRNLEQQVKKNKYNSQFITSLKTAKQKLREQKNLVSHQYEQQKRITKQYKRRLSQLQIEVKNLSQLLKIKDKSWEETHSEYKLSLDENKGLYNTIKEQRSKIEELLFEKKQFNNKILSLMADASFQKKRKEQLQFLYHQADEEMRKMREDVRRSQLLKKIAEDHKESMQADLKQNYESIRKMHSRNFQMEEQLQELKSFKFNLKPLLAERDQELQRIRLRNDELQKNNEDLKTCFTRSQFKFKTYRNQVEPRLETYQKLIQKFRFDKKQADQLEQNRGNTLTAYQVEISKLKEALSNAIMMYKNENFERTNLKQNYDQSLFIIEAKNKEEKKLNIEISEMKETIATKNHEINRINLNHNSLIQTHENMKKKLNNKIKQQENVLTMRASHIHPFLFQDLAENYRKTCDQREKAYFEIKQLNRKISALNSHYENKFQTMEKSNEQYIAEITTQKDKIIARGEVELEYERQKNQKIKKKLDKLQALASTYQQKIEERTTSEREKIYASVIQQKTKKIEELGVKLETNGKQMEQMREQFLKKEEQYEEKCWEMGEALRKERSQHEDIVHQMNLQVEWLQTKVQQLKDELSQEEKNMQERINQQAQILMSRKQSTEKHIQKKYVKTQAKWSKMAEVEEQNPAIKKRNDISRKLQLAYTYKK